MKTLLPLIVLAAFLGSCSTDRESRPPNIIYILADDLGYGDLSSFGQERFSTPNIDRLAKEGMKLTQHYAGCTVCAPSRSALMTGQHTGHTPIRGNLRTPPEGQWPIPDGTFTLAEMLRQKGYVTGAFGKWGLGGPGSVGDPVNQGFDVFFGYNSQTLAHNYYPRHLWSNREKIMLAGNEGSGKGVYAPELIQKKAMEFLEENRDRPFFLYYPTTIPHAELVAPEKYMEKYRGKYLPEKSYKGAEEGDPRYQEGAYNSQPEAHAAFAAMINLLDDQVGELVNRVRELGLADNTLIIFTSDNVEGGADPVYFDSNGPFRGFKRDLYEGGIRVPTIAWWPGRIKPGSVSDLLSAFWDVFPTLAELTGQQAADSLDGISFLPTLLGQPGQQEHEYLYWEFHELRGRQAVRKGDWKLVRYNVFDPENTTTELYNIPADPGETKNLAGEHPEIVEELTTLMKQAHTPSAVFPFPGEKQKNP